MAGSNLGKVRADTAEEAMMAKPQDLEYGGPDWSEQLRCAIREATAEAVAEPEKRESCVLLRRCGLLARHDARRS